MRSWHQPLPLHAALAVLDGLRADQRPPRTPRAEYSRCAWIKGVCVLDSRVCHSQMRGDTTTLELRVLADRTIVEIYVGPGRGVVTTPVLHPGLDPAKTSAFIFPAGSVSTSTGSTGTHRGSSASRSRSGAGGGLRIASASVYSMGCAWARYP